MAQTFFEKKIRKKHHFEMKYFSGLIIALVFLSNVYVLAEDDWTKSCGSCKCQWAATKRKADCVGTSQVTIPKHLSYDIQLLDLSYNNIPEIQRDEFIDANLQNLQKLIIKNCTLVEINRDAFKGLGILIELDLSQNNLKVIHPGTFDGLDKIRTIKLDDNEIDQLQDKTFRDLVFLTKVELRNNRLTKIGILTFLNLPKLRDITLDSNRLQTLNKETFEGLYLLRSLQLWENSWNCSCEMR